MSFAGGVCPELGFRGKLPHESIVIPIILVKGLHGEPKLAYFVSVGYFLLSVSSVFLRGMLF